MLKDKTLDTLNKKLIILFLALLPFFSLIRPLFDNDTYTLLNTGKYILHNGFPHVEPFTIHANLHFVVEQWLTAAIYYILYSNLGLFSLYIFAIINFYGIGLLIYLLSRNISDGNKPAAFTVSLFSCLFLSIFMVLRPQTLSLLILLAEILLLENYIKNGNKKPLLFLPLLSLLLINLHSALWIFFFILLIPYFIDGFKINLFFIRGQGYPKSFLLIITLISFAAGFINPYGFEAMTYLFKSYGNTSLNLIQEVKSPDFKTGLGIIIFVIYALLLALYMINKKGGIKLRYALITLGTAYLGLSSVRNLLLFIGLSYPLLAYNYRAFRLPSVTEAKETNKSKLTKTVLIVTMLCLMTGMKISFSSSDISSDYVPEGAVKYMKANLDINKIRLFNDFNSGAYLEFEGIRTFIDPRAEVFFKSINRKEDIMKDYVDLLSGKFHYRDFVKKYRFTHLLVQKGSLIETYLMHDTDFKPLYKDKDYSLFKTNTP